jgi:hypothetical protein
MLSDVDFAFVAKTTEQLVELRDAFSKLISSGKIFKDCKTKTSLPGILITNLFDSSIGDQEIKLEVTFRTTFQHQLITENMQRNVDKLFKTDPTRKTTYVSTLERLARIKILCQEQKNSSSSSSSSSSLDTFSAIYKEAEAASSLCKEWQKYVCPKCQTVATIFGQDFPFCGQLCFAASLASASSSSSFSSSSSSSSTVDPSSSSSLCSTRTSVDDQTKEFQNLKPYQRKRCQEAAENVYINETVEVLLKNKTAKSLMVAKAKAYHEWLLNVRIRDKNAMYVREAIKAGFMAGLPT